MKNIVVYGLGRFFEKHKAAIYEEYNISAYVDRNKEGIYDGNPIIGISQIGDIEGCEILIMLADIEQCFAVIRDLLAHGCEAGKIVLGSFRYGSYHEIFDELNVTEASRLEIVVHDIRLEVGCVDEFNNAKEVLVEECYHYHLNNGKKDVVIDVGMNIGDAVLYFLSMDHVEKVYGFEPFEKTFHNAQSNLRKNNVDLRRVELFPVGLSGCNEERTISFNDNMTCGQSTIADVRDKAYADYLDWGLVDKQDEQTAEVEVRRASEVLEPILKENPDRNIVLKMDCEGEEYGIMEDLYDSGVLQKIDYIMMEWHYMGRERILHRLDQAGFSWWTLDMNQDMGLIYAFK